MYVTELIDKLMKVCPLNTISSGVFKFKIFCKFIQGSYSLFIIT